MLRLGGNNDNSRQRVAAEFMKQKPLDEIAAFLSREYVGGGGFKTDAGELSAWYASDGIHLARGRSAQHISSAQVISWQDAAVRIGELLEQGQFATNVELAETNSYTRSQLAQSLWYLRHDFDEPAIAQGYLPAMEEYRGGGFPDETARLADALRIPSTITVITQEYEQFWNAYRNNRDLLRFRNRHTDEIMTGLHELALPWREYETEMTEPPQIGRFITEDEITAALTYGSSVEGGKGRIYGYFSENHTPKEQADFLKNEYGIGGHNGALPGSFHSWEDHSSKGIQLKKLECATIELSWSTVAKRISGLVRKDRYLTPEEKVRYLANEALKAVPSSYTDYTALKEQHPNDLVLYQVGHFYEIYDDDAQAAVAFLKSSVELRTVTDGENRRVFRVPDSQLTEYVNHLREQFDLTISGIDPENRTRQVYSIVSIDHEAERATDAHEAEFGADGWRAFPGNAPEQPIIREPFEQYKPVVIAAVSEDVAYRNACGHSDRENAGIECNAAVRRAILNSGDMELIRLFSDMPEFRSSLHQEVFDETYPRLQELLRPLSQDDIDAALQRWNGDIASKRRVQDYMADHARDKDTAAWLSREYSGSETKSLFVVRTGSPEAMELQWPKVQRRLAQLVKEDRFFTEQELESFDDIDAAAIREELAERGIADEATLNSVPVAQRATADTQEARYEVIVYHHFENGFDERLDYQTLQEAEKAARGYVDGTLEVDGFAYDGAAVYDLQDKKYLRIFGDYPDPAAHEQAAAQELPPEHMEQIAEAFGAAGLQYDDINSYGCYLVFHGESGDPYSFESWDEAAEWIGGVVFDELERNAAAERVIHPERFEQPASQQSAFHHAVGDTIYLENNKPFIVESVTDMHIQLRDPSLYYPILRAESVESFARLMERFPQKEREAPDIQPPADNFRITDDNLSTGGAKVKFRMNMAAINLLQELELDGRQATPEEQEVLSKYVGWGGLADAFDENKPAWTNEFQELYATLSPEEYTAARSSTLNAHYTSPAVIRAIYEAVENMGFQTGNILEPSMGVGNFFGLLPDNMAGSKLYGVELDSITGRIAKQLYPKADITVAGFETTNRKDFFDLAIGNVPFGQSGSSPERQTSSRQKEDTAGIGCAAKPEESA